MTPLNTRALTPMAFVADVARSIAFYRRLGFSARNTVARPGADELTWAWLTSGDAHLMVARASHPVEPESQAVLFYLYVDDVGAAHGELAAAGAEVGPVTNPFYAPQGEFRLVDPDGYSLMICHV
ncbi:MAG TPA: VOC family protein [Pyrinomonadaceae bacterium]|jgi:uncharacterized glyoxalase superfamily protein PhnB